MKKIMCMAALAIALIGTGQVAFAQGIVTGSEANQASGGTTYELHGQD